MRLIPAIDLRGGRCVRLLKGDFAAETTLRGRTPGSCSRATAATAPTGCTSSTWTARGTAAAATAAIIATSPPRPASTCRWAAVCANSRRSSACSTSGVARVVVGSAAVDRAGRGARLARALRRRPHRAGLRRAPRRRRHAARRHPRLARGNRRCLCGTRSPVPRAAISPRAVHRCEPRRRTVAAQRRPCMRRPVRRHPSVAWQASGGIRDARDLHALAGCGAAAAISGKALLEDRIPHRGAADHSCQTHNSLSRRARRAGGQGRALSRPPRRRRHHGSRARATATKAPTSSCSTTSPRAPRALGGPHLGQAGRAHARHPVLRGRRHPHGGRCRGRCCRVPAPRRSPSIRPLSPTRADRCAQPSASARNASWSASTARPWTGDYRVQQFTGDAARAATPRAGTLDWVRRGAAARRRRDRAQLHVQRRRAPGLRPGPAARRTRALPGPAGGLRRRRSMRHFSEVFHAPRGVDAALAASVFHSGDIAIPDSSASCARTASR